MRFVSFGFDFAANTGSERMINIDNVRLVDMETAEQDWIHLPQITEEGLSNVENSLNAQYVKAEGSVASLKMIASADMPGLLSLNVMDSLDYTLMHRGTLSAWFYFGDQEPAAALVTTDSGLNVCAEALEFAFGENQDGWYEGKIDLSQMIYAEEVNRSYIIMLTIAVPNGYTVYMDGLTYADIVEDASYDLIHLHSNNIGTIGSDKVYGDLSVQSLFVPAASKAANMDFVPAEALNFANGKLTGWFYFGENEPSTVRFVAYSGASNSGYVVFTFEEGADGWYYGTADMAEVPSAKQGVLNSVNKFRVQVGKGVDIYLDQLVFVPNPTEVEPEVTEPEVTDPEASEVQITDPTD